MDYMGLENPLTMSSLYLILTSIIFPVLAISWLCCIALCIYKGLLKNLRLRPDRNTKVQIVVTDRRASASNSSGNSVGHVNQSSLHRTAPLWQWSNGSSHNSPRTARNGQPSAPTTAAAASGPPDVEIVPDPDVLNQSQRSNNSFLNTSQGSLLLADAIKEARRNSSKKGLKDTKTAPLYYPQLPQATDVRETSINPMAPLQPPWPRLPPLDPHKKLRNQSSETLPSSVRNFLEASQRRSRY